MEDKQIIRLFWQRADRAISALAEKYEALLLKLAGNILQDPRDAEEAVSDTYLALWNAIPPAKPDPLRAYSCRVCRNQALKRLRHDRAARRNAAWDLSLEELSGCIPGTALEETLSARDLGRSIDRFLSTQSRESRVIFLRRYWFGDSIQDIAISLGMKESAVSTRLSRCRKALGSYLCKEGYL